MVSREVATVPRPIPSRRTIAVPLSPKPSINHPEGDCYASSLNATSHNLIKNTLSPVEITLNSPKSVQTISSSIELSRHNDHSVIDSRKSRSQEEIKMSDESFRRDVLKLLEAMAMNNNELKPDKCMEKHFVKDLRRGNCGKDDGDNIHDFKYCICDLFPKDAGSELDFLINKLIANINIKNTDFQGRHLDRDAILSTVAKRIKIIIFDSSIPCDKLKIEILNILESIPVQPCNNIKSYMNKLIDIMLDKLSTISVKCYSRRTEETICCEYCNQKILSKRKKKTELNTKEYFETLLNEILTDFFDKSDVQICKSLLRIIENELVDILIDSRENRSEDIHIQNRMKEVLKDFSELTDEQTTHLTAAIFQCLNELPNQPRFRKTYPVYHNISHSHHDAKYGFDSFNKNKFDSCIDDYTRQVTEQIEQWFAGLNLSQTLDAGIKQVVISDLAADIVERYMYLKISPNSKNTDFNELESLKFQIFKWINKLVGDNNTETIRHAQELMDRIKSVPTPKLKSPRKLWKHNEKIPYDRQNSSNFKRLREFDNQNQVPSESIRSQIRNLHCYRSETEIVSSQRSKTHEAGRKLVNELKFFHSNIPEKAPHHMSGNTHPVSEPRRSVVGLDDQYLYRTSVEHSDSMAGPLQQSSAPTESARNCCQNPTSSSPGHFRVPIPIPQCCTEKDSSLRQLSIKELNEDYDNYLQRWIQQIPIPVNNAEEQNLANLARLGIYNGIWRAITKLKFDPNIHSNPYYYQDVLDDEIQDLLSDLPQTKELGSITPRLVAELLEKTVTTNKRIIDAAIPACFEQQLLEILDNQLPKISTFDPMKQKVELQKLIVVENYILFTRYNDNEVCRNSFLKEIEQLANLVTRYRDDYTKGSDTLIYINELINALNRVPLPNDEKLEEEAHDILVKREIGDWLADLPLKADIDPLDRLRLRNMFAKRIEEIEKHVNLSDCSGRAEMQKLLPRHLEKLPLQDGINLNFYIEELSNRIKNLLLKNEGRKKSVSFTIPQDYGEFSMDMPGCSSYIGTSTNDYEGSYMIVGGEVIKNPGPKSWRSYKESLVTEGEWLSTEGTRVPPGMLVDFSREGAPHAGHVSFNQVVPNQAALVTQVPEDIPGHFVQGSNIQVDPRASFYIDCEPPAPYGPPIQNFQGNSVPNGQAPTVFSDPVQRFSNVIPSAPPESSLFPPSSSKPDHYFATDISVDANRKSVGFSQPKYDQQSVYDETKHSAVKDNNINSNAQINNSHKRKRKLNLQPMARGGVGDLGTSQIAGSSRGSYGAGQSKPINDWSQEKKFYLSTDKEGIRKVIEHYKQEKEKTIDPARFTRVSKRDSGSMTEIRFSRQGLRIPEFDAGYTDPMSMRNIEPITPYMSQAGGYSTPQQPITQTYPERPQKLFETRRKIDEPHVVKRRLELDDEIETESEDEDVVCMCRRSQSLRRQRFHPFDTPYRYPPYMSMMPCPYFF